MISWQIEIIRKTYNKKKQETPPYSVVGLTNAHSRLKKNTIGSRTTEFTLVDYPTAERRTTHNMCGAMDD